VTEGYIVVLVSVESNKQSIEEQDYHEHQYIVAIVVPSILMVQNQHQLQ